MRNYFPTLMGRFVFLLPNGDVLPPSRIVQKYRRKYNELGPTECLKWLEENGIRVLWR